MLWSVLRLIFKTSLVTSDFFYVFNLILSFSTGSQSFKKICAWEVFGRKCPSATQNGKKIVTVAWTPYFRTWTLFLQGKCFGTCRQVIYEMFYCLNLAFGPRRKNHISGYTWPRSFIQTVQCSVLDEKIVYQSFYGAPLTFRYLLLQGKVLCFARVSKSLARCLLLKCSKDLVEKIISPIKFDTNRPFKQ